MAELNVEAKVEKLDEVLAFLDRELESCDCPMKTQMQLEVATEELFVNIAHYAYGEQAGRVTVRVETQSAPRAVSVTFIDSGMPYDPLKREDPDITLSAEQRQIGGLGVYMVKKSMDSVEYEYRDGQNVLTIRKNL